MEVVNVHEAKTHLSRLLERVLAGEDILIARAGQPVARLTSVSARRVPRRGGQWAGRMDVPEDWEAPLPPEIQDGFEGGGS